MQNALRIAAILAISYATLGFTPSTSHSQDLKTSKIDAVKPEELARPTTMPDRIILTWSGDPMTTQSVTWRTATTVKESLAEIIEADAGPNFSEKSRQVAAKTMKLVTDLNEANFHSVEFTGLKPATKYSYRVGDGTNWSEWFHFRTAPNKPEPFSFIYFGDAQNNIRSLWSRVIREAYSDAPKARFIIHAGDLITTAESDAQWGEWFGAGGWLNGMVPSVPVPGNHEQQKVDDKTRRLSHHWRAQFTLPEDGPVPETCYTLVYGNMRLIALNSNEKIPEQTKWLEETLAANKSEWVVCTFHHPIYSTAKDRDNAALRNAWKPLFDKYHVDLVLQGHDHTYGRTGLEVPTTIEIKKKDSDDKAKDESTAKLAEAAAKVTTNLPTGVSGSETETGTVYVVSVSGPKMYNNGRWEFMKRIAEDTQLYQIIHIDGSTLHFEARTAIGDVYDAFDLKKNPGKINELVEIPPTMPARLRPPAKEDDKAATTSNSTKSETEKAPTK